MVTLEERLTAIPKAIADGASTIQEIIIKTGLSRTTVYKYARERGIKIPRVRLPMKERLLAIEKVIPEGDDPVDIASIAAEVQLAPATTLRYLEIKGGVNIGEMDRTYEVKVTPQRDELVLQGVEQGLTLEQIGASIELAKQGARLYLKRMGIYEQWKLVRSKRELDAQRVQLISLLKRHLYLRAAAEGWAMQRAVESFYIRDRRTIKLEDIYPIFQKYAAAKAADKKLSLKELAEGTRFTSSQVAKLLEGIGVEPMYGKLLEAKISRWFKQPERAKDLLFKAAELGSLAGLETQLIALRKRLSFSSQELDEQLIKDYLANAKVEGYILYDQKLEARLRSSFNQPDRAATLLTPVIEKGLLFDVYSQVTILQQQLRAALSGGSEDKRDKKKDGTVSNRITISVQTLQDYIANIGVPGYKIYDKPTAGVIRSSFSVVAQSL